MKKYFFAGLVVVILAAIGIVGYGAWLNYQGENQIMERMANRIIPLKGEKTMVRELRPQLKLDNANFYSNDMADAVALIDGRITDDYVSRNSMVKKGQIISRLVNDEIPTRLKQADSAILRAEAELVRAKNTYQRYSKLIVMNAASAEKYDEAEAAWRAAIGSLEEAKAQRQQIAVQADRQQVTAPVDGEVLIMYRQRGSYVTAGTAVALIGDFRRLYFSRTLDSRQSEGLAVGNEVALTFERSDFSKVYNTDYRSGNKAGQNQLQARIVDITPSLGEAAAFRKVVWEIDNTAGLLEPQTYNDIKITALEGRTCLAVPLTAMADSDNGSLFVLNSDGVLERRTIQTGIEDGEYIEVLAGIAEGDIVITSETDGLQEGMKADVELEGTER